MSMWRMGLADPKERLDSVHVNRFQMMDEARRWINQLWGLSNA